MRLSDVKPIPKDQIEATAKWLDEKNAKKDGSSSPDQAKKSSPRRSPKADLGNLLVEKYLAHYGVAYTIKKDDKGTIYRLTSCLFNSAHTKNEAAIIQLNNGKVLYQCFHVSCKGRKWVDAKALISGAASLAPFCENYDPKRYVVGAAVDSPFATEKSAPLPERMKPEDIHPTAFFKRTKHGNKFVPQFLAKFLQSFFNPIVCDGGEFYHYNGAGVWKSISPDRIGQVAEQALDMEAKSAYIFDAIKLLGNRVYRDPDDLKHDPHWLNLKNGMLSVNMDQLELMPHDASYMSRIQLPVKFNPEAKCDRWLQFQEEVFPGAPDKTETLQRYYGYCLLPDCRFQRCLFLIGGGANGKSKAVDILVEVLGKENVCSLPLQLMGERFLIGQLKDKLVNIATEIATSTPIQTSNFKDAVAGGLLMADQKHGKPFSFYPIAKHIFSMNEVPKITDKSYGFQRRPIVLTFTEKFEGKDADRQLHLKLAAEREGIFAWMLEGLAKVLDSGDLLVPESVEADTQEFIKSTNPVLLFADDCCVLGDNYYVKPKQLYKLYLTWCEEGKIRYPLTRNRFYDQILIHFPHVKKGQYGDNRLRQYKGIGLIAPDLEE